MMPGTEVERVGVRVESGLARRSEVFVPDEVMEIPTERFHPMPLHADPLVKTFGCLTWGHVEWTWLALLRGRNPCGSSPYSATERCPLLPLGHK